MCGIFGYVGKQNPVELVIGGLKKLEYRGYDSAGIAGLKGGQLFSCKEVGKVAILEKELKGRTLDLDVAIAHTRWATHGKPSEINAHPHFDAARSLALVHNGIIENHESLRHQLEEQGHAFLSETDTEVIAQLIGSLYQGSILEAVQQAISLLEGSFAIALLHRDFPQQIVAAAHESPLVIGIGNQEAFISSDSHAFVGHTREMIPLFQKEIAVIKADGIEIFDSSLEKIQKESLHISIEEEESSKGGYEHFTLKEIHEQPQSIRKALLSRCLEDYGTAVFEELKVDVNELLSVERILILACGTSWHAGCVASYLIEDMARIPVEVEISSEFRYKNPIVPPGTLVIAISQSGETADTLAAVREVKAKGAKALGICNVRESTLVRETDSTIFLHAGREVGVCSTKAFTSQLTVLSLLALQLARMRHMSKEKGKEFLRALKILPEQVQQVLAHAEDINSLAKKNAKYDHFFFLGRGYMYPTALEAALKLKEIAYINANGYPAGEIKHGPIALISENSPTVALCANKKTYNKLLSNLMEVKARKGKIIAIAQQGDAKIENVADEIIYVPSTIDPLAAIPTSVAMQLFAYYIAYERGEDIDQPRHLAKSVTVE
ncbi:MAG: glutamine--fructose-6-phosphate transaminase (isomerizing) [Waddliaceae bacterium]